MKLQHTFLALTFSLALALNACVGPKAASTPSITGQSIVCPDPATGFESLKIDSHGYCAAIPTGYSVLYPNPAEIIVWHGSQLDPAPDPVRLYIQVQDAGGRSPAGLADQITAGLGGGFPVERADLALGGEPAVSLNNVPGQDLSRQILTVHGGWAYKLTFVPLDVGQAETRQQLETLYEVVVRSFKFVGSPQ